MTKPFDQAVDEVKRGASLSEQAKFLYDLLTEEERLWVLDGDLPFHDGIMQMMTTRYNLRPYIMGQIDRIGIPGIHFVDGPRGCVSGEGTAFPVAMARGATWDVQLEEQIGDVIGQEVRARGGNFFGGICINLARHPAWGRVQETYGDEPYQLGSFGAALCRGVKKHTMTCVKHYALNSMENKRFEVDVSVSQEDLHDVYLPHFKQVIDEGVDSVMSAYNAINGEWAGHHNYLLTDVLRGLWKFDGFVISDFVMGLRDSAASLNAGLDLEAPYIQQRAQYLATQIESGETDWSTVEQSCLRILKIQLKHYAARLEDGYPEALIANKAAAQLAREVASRSMVLLKNEDKEGRAVLPIEPSKVKRIALIGRLANAPNMGDHGSSRVVPPYYVTPEAGIRARYPDAQIELVSEDNPDAAELAAKNADVAIVVAGYDYRDEGEFFGGNQMRSNPEFKKNFPPPPEGFEEKMAELAASKQSDDAAMKIVGGDRSSLELREVDREIIKKVSAANPKTIVAIIAAGAVLMDEWRDDVPALMMMWYAGMEGGHALADIISGDVNPAGRLPYAIAQNAKDLPFFDKDATAIEYGRLYGQRLIDANNHEPAYAHGFGLSYTEFVISNATIKELDAEKAALQIAVENTGSRDGIHIVQVYGKRLTGQHANESMLVGFAPVKVNAGTSQSVDVTCSFEALALWNESVKKRELPALENVELRVSSYAGDPDALTLVMGG